MPEQKTKRTHDVLMMAIDEFKREGFTSQYNSVLREIANSIYKDKANTYISVRHIVQRTWISESQVRMIIRRLREEGLITVEYRDHTTSLYALRFNEKWLPFLPYKQKGDNREAPTSSEGTHPDRHTAPTPGRTAPTDSTTTPTEDSTQTVNLTRSLNQIVKTETEPGGGSVRDFASRETEQGDTRQECLSAADLSPDLLKVRDTFRFLFPNATINVDDLAGLLRSHSADYLETIVTWVKNETRSHWREHMGSTAYLVSKFPKMCDVYANHMASRQSSSRPPSAKASERPESCPRKCIKGRLAARGSWEWEACSCPEGMALPEKTGQVDPLDYCRFNKM